MGGVPLGMDGVDVGGRLFGVAGPVVVVPLGVVGPTVLGVVGTLVGAGVHSPWLELAGGVALPEELVLAPESVVVAGGVAVAGQGVAVPDVPVVLPGGGVVVVGCPGLVAVGLCPGAGCGDVLVVP